MDNVELVTTQGQGHGRVMKCSQVTHNVNIYNLVVDMVNKFAVKNYFHVRLCGILCMPHGPHKENNNE